MKTPSESTNKKGPLTIFFMVITLLAILGIFYIYLAIWRVPDNRKTAEKIRNETIEKIEKGNAIPKEDNAWFTYYEAVEKFEKFRADNIKNVDENTPSIDSKGLTPENTEIIKKYVEDNGEAMELAREAYKKKSFQIPRDYQLGANEKSQNYLAVRSFAFLLVLNGDIQAKEGKNREAVELYLEALRLGEGVGHNGVLLMGMIDIALESIAIRHITAFINDYDADAETYRFLTGEMSRLRKEQTPFIDFMDNEAVYAYYTMELIKSGKMGTSSQMRAMKTAGLMIEREKRIYENQYLKDRAAASLPYGQAIKALTENVDTDLPKYTILPRILYPNYKQAYQHSVLVRSQYGGAMIAAALKLYNKEKGKYPESLMELAPDYLKEIPGDPLSADGKYVYKKDGDNILLYSIGPDLKDDNGTPRSSPYDVESPGDLIFLKVVKK